jgi:hypothetical protein
LGGLLAKSRKHSGHTHLQLPASYILEILAQRPKSLNLILKEYRLEEAQLLILRYVVVGATLIEALEVYLIDVVSTDNTTLESLGNRG